MYVPLKRSITLTVPRPRAHTCWDTGILDAAHCAALCELLSVSLGAPWAYAHGAFMQPTSAVLLHAYFPLQLPSSTVFLATPHPPATHAVEAPAQLVCPHVDRHRGTSRTTVLCIRLPAPVVRSGVCEALVHVVGVDCAGTGLPGVTDAFDLRLPYVAACPGAGRGGCGPCFVSLAKHLPDVVCTTAVRQCGSHQTPMRICMLTHTQAPTRTPSSLPLSVLCRLSTSKPLGPTMLGDAWQALPRLTKAGGPFITRWRATAEPAQQVRLASCATCSDTGYRQRARLLALPVYTSTAIVVSPLDSWSCLRSLIEVHFPFPYDRETRPWETRWHQHAWARPWWLRWRWAACCLGPTTSKLISRHVQMGVLHQRTHAPCIYSDALCPVATAPRFSVAVGNPKGISPLSDTSDLAKCTPEAPAPCSPPVVSVDPSAVTRTTFK